MSGYGDLARLGATVRPLTTKVPAGGRRSLFLAPLSQTVTLMAREIELLGGSRVVLEIDLRDRDIRVDGLPRADARPTSPAVAVAFESRHGPLRYATAEFSDWKDNLRAVALAMEALRAVDRYGVSKRGEQYQGWRALPASTDPAEAIQTEEQARAVLAEYGGDWRRAARATHPDQDGNPDEFRRVMRAKEILDAR